MDVRVGPWRRLSTKELMFSNCGVGKDSWESLNFKEIKPVKEINPEHSVGLMLKLQYFGHLMWRTDWLEKILMLGKIEDRRRGGRQRMRWLYSITDSMDMNLSKSLEIVKDKEAWYVHGVTKSWTWLNEWTTKPEAWYHFLFNILFQMPGSSTKEGK